MRFVALSIVGVPILVNKKSYLDWIDRIELPRGFKFSIFIYLLVIEVNLQLNILQSLQANVLMQVQVRSSNLDHLPIH